MKKSISILIIFIMMVSMVACGGKENDVNKGDSFASNNNDSSFSKEEKELFEKVKSGEEQLFILSDEEFERYFEYLYPVSDEIIGATLQEGAIQIEGRVFYNNFQNQYTVGQFIDNNSDIVSPILEWGSSNSIVELKTSVNQIGHPSIYLHVDKPDGWYEKHQGKDEPDVDLPIEYIGEVWGGEALVYYPGGLSNFCEGFTIEDCCSYFESYGLILQENHDACPGYSIYDDGSVEANVMMTNGKVATYRFRSPEWLDGEGYFFELFDVSEASDDYYVFIEE